MRGKRLRGIFPVLLLFASIVSCVEKKTETDGNDVDRLYTETLRLIRVYSDSIVNAPDTAEVSSLFRNFNHQLERLNFDVKADTDLALDECRNDTLAIKLTGIRQLYDRKMTEAVKPAVDSQEEEEADE